MSTPRSTHVFISYAHDGKVKYHKANALELATSLRRRGVDAQIDQWVEHTPEFWPIWMAHQVHDADFVLCLGSPMYKERCDQLGDPTVGRGARWEGALITHAMYANIIEAPGKFIAVLLDGTSDSDIPDVLMPFGYTHYRWPEEDEMLYRRITGQPLLIPPPLGPLVIY